MAANKKLPKIAKKILGNEKQGGITMREHLFYQIQMQICILQQCGKLGIDTEINTTDS